MVDKRAIKVDTLDELAEGFQKSRGITHKLTTKEMIELAKVPTASGENKFTQLVGGTLTEITAADLEGITSVRKQAFSNAQSIKNIVFPNNIITMGEYVCNGCAGLESVILPENMQLTILPKYAFNFCTTLREIVIPNNFTILDDYAFGNCGALSSVVLPNTLTTINNNVFYYTDLTSIVIPNSVSSIGNSVFYGCNQLTSLTLSNSLTTLSNQLLYQCSKLTNLTIPAGVTTIGNQSLSIGDYGYNATITFLSTTPPSIQSKSFGNYVKKIIVPAGYGEAYKTATNWANFADFIEEATE